MVKKLLNFILFFIISCPGICFAGLNEANPRLVFFYSAGCHECMEIKTQVLPGLQQRYKDTIAIDFRDIADIENYKFLLGLKKQYGILEDLKVPVVFLEGNFLNGRDSIVNRLDKLIEVALSNPGSAQAERSSFDLVQHFLSFTPLTVTGAGLIDGINPCAFGVIVFFISFLALQGYRKKELMVIGISFIIAVFLTYLLIGLGFFGFFYCLKGFWLVRKIVNLAIGVLSIVLGLLAMKDFFKYKRTGKTEEMSLQLPNVLKNRIHAVIAVHYRRPKQASQSAQKPLLSLVIATFITGLLVSILEAVCTGQTYLPTISFILKTTHIKLAAFIFLILYNLMFIVPLFIIFILALLGVSSEQLTGFLKRNFLTTKALMAVLFFGLGVFIIWRG